MSKMGPNREFSPTFPKIMDKAIGMLKSSSVPVQRLKNLRQVGWMHKEHKTLMGYGELSVVREIDGVLYTQNEDWIPIFELVE